MNNKRPISEVGLEEDAVDDNESQESENESIVSETNSEIDESIEENSEIDESMEENSKIDESVKENSMVFGLKVRDEFMNWDAAERQVQNYAMEVGFDLVKCCLEKNKHGEIVHHTFECKNSSKYKAKKKADNEDVHECKSAKVNCSWRVNLNLSGGAVYVTLLNEVYNHLLYKKIQDVSSKHRRLSPKMLNEVEFLVNIGCEA
ncbi:15307_t:CDS:1, partial [Racocetra fulgida]